VQVTFTKKAHTKDFPPWVARIGKSTVVGSHLGCEPDRLGHDLVTFVVERELGIDDGFFGTVAAGGTFRSMGKRRHAAGKQVIAHNRPGLTRAEGVVHRAWDDWLDGRDAPCNAALDAALAEWSSVLPGGSLTLDWLPSAGRRRHTQMVMTTLPRARPSWR
jgi:hypothetical protein